MPREAEVNTAQTWQLHDDATLRHIDQAAVRLLDGSGCRIEHQGLLHLLQGAGCRVDSSAGRCFLPERLVRDAVSHLGGRLGAEVEIQESWNPQHHLNHGGSYPHLLDWPSGHRRLATKEDVVDMARMAHALPEFHTLGRVLTCSEIHPRIEPLWTTLAIARITDKPLGGGEIFFPEYIESLVRMGEVLHGTPGDTSLIAACDFFIAPLVFDRRQAQCFLEKRRFGIMNVPGTMPIAGMSAPVTVAGTVTVAIAELLAGWVLGYVVDPGIPASGIVSSGTLDMQTAAACFGSPEALLQDMTTVQICRRLYGIEVRAATGYVDCKRPGLEAVFQKMLPLVSSPFGIGESVEATGLLSAGQDYSPVQHLLDAEVRAGVERFRGGFRVDAETMAAGLIEEVVQGTAPGFLESDHTARHFQSEQWYPRWFDRRLWQSESEMLERMDRHCKDAIKRYEPPDIDPAKIRELESILKSAEREAPGTGSR